MRSVLGDANASRLSQRLQPRRDVHPIAVDVVWFSDHVAQVDADAKPYAPLLGHRGFALDHPALDLRSAADRVHHARKLREEAVAGVLYDPTAVFDDFRLDQLPEMPLEPFVRAFLIRPIRRE